MAVNSIDAEDDQFAYRYDTQLLIERRDKDLDEDEISDYITDNLDVYKRQMYTIMVQVRCCWTDGRI